MAKSETLSSAEHGTLVHQQIEKRLLETGSKSTAPLYKLDVVSQLELMNERKAEKIATPYGNPSDSSTWELV